MAIEYLRHLRDDFDDDIPEVKGWGQFKVQRKWWQQLFFGLEDALTEGKILPDLKKDVGDFMEYYSSEKFHRQTLTGIEDLQRANSLIDKICGKKS